ncbi:MAG: geranylgeranyl reductase family protein [Armatimonadetes bacterium]|nr:geranylgeranyl reductase family protein [Armatimonadota bacterium]
MQIYDALVIGSGPAGAMAAYEMAVRGLSVCIVEKERLPRYKTCGGGVQARVLRMLPFSIDPVVERVVTGMQIGFGLRRPFLRYYGQPLIYMTMRDRFDRFLTEQAVLKGAELREGMRVDSIRQDESGVIVSGPEGTLQGRFLVGADGAKGVAARMVGLGQDTRRYAAMEAEVEVAGAACAVLPDCARIDWGTFPSGYAWTFPKAEVYSTGAATLESSKVKPYYEKYLRASLRGSSPSLRRLSGHPLCFRSKGAPLHAGRALLAGDAAGLLDPFTGEGIHHAVLSGQIAAAVIGEEAGRRTPSLARYTARIEETIAPEMEHAEILSRVFRLTGRQVHGAIHYNDRAWNAFCRLLRGERTYGDLLRRFDSLPQSLHFFGRAVMAVWGE